MCIISYLEGKFNALQPEEHKRSYQASNAPLVHLTYKGAHKPFLRLKRFFKMKTVPVQTGTLALFHCLTHSLQNCITRLLLQ